MYTAAVLFESSANILKELAESKFNLEGFDFKTPAGGSLPHHMTINLGSFDKELNNQHMLGRYAILSVESLWMCRKIGACAALVKTADAIWCCRSVDNNFTSHPINSSNEYKHITICLMPHAKPSHSNQLFLADDVEIQNLDPFDLESIVEEID